MDDIKEISIVLVGSWNVKIFTPTWVMRELLNLEGNEEVGLGFNSDLQPIYTFKNVHLLPTERAFEIRFNEISEESIKIANEIVIRLTSALPFTPKLLVGFNYKLSKKCDLENISIPNYSDKYKLNEIKLSKEETNFTLNVILNCLQDSQTVLYNFHYKNLNFIKDNSIVEHVEYIKKYGN